MDRPGGQSQEIQNCARIDEIPCAAGYEQIQAAIEGQTDKKTGPLLKPVIKPLYEAYAILDQARQKRGALDLDLPEKQILIDEKGNMTGVKQRVRLDSHKLIEEFMILANVAAAKALEARKAPCVYRIHDRPSFEKLDSAREFLESFDLSLPKGQTIKPAQLNHLLNKAAKLPYSHLSAPSSCAPRRRPFMRPKTSAISGWRSSAMRILPPPSGVMPICWCIAL